MADFLDDLEAEGAALVGSAPTVAEAEAPAVEEDPTICKRGPCVFFADVQFPTGIELRPGLVAAQRRCFCQAGVQFEERKADPRVATFLGSTVALPIDCSMWSPMTQEEIDERDARRLEEQDRYGAQREAAAALSAAQKEAP